jgi:hypothetical protein
MRRTVWCDEVPRKSRRGEASHGEAPRDQESQTGKEYGVVTVQRAGGNGGWGAEEGHRYAKEGHELH